MREIRSLHQCLYGTDQPPPEVRRVTLADLSFSVDGAQLRHLKVGDMEVLRALGPVIRDAHWGTHELQLQGAETEAGDALWLHRGAGVIEDAAGGAMLDWQVSLQVEPRRVRVDTWLSARRDFTTCRAGLVLLHPLAGVVGAPVTVTHSDGSAQTGCFPELISPAQPFFDIRELRHSPLPGLQLHWRLSGDVFEMEDQRNWSDASFKTYNRPLAWACPYVLAAGSQVHQQIELNISGRGQV